MRLLTQTCTDEDNKENEEADEEDKDDEEEDEMGGVHPSVSGHS